MLKIVGYPDRYSVAPGETVNFKVSLEEGSSFDARLVRVVHGDANPDGPGLKFRHIASNADGSFAGKPQRADMGSFMRVEGAPSLGGEAFTFFAVLWPTLVSRADQTILCQWDAATASGFRIGLSEKGLLSVTLARNGKEVVFTAAHAMLNRQWYTVGVSIDPASGAVSLFQRSHRKYARVTDSFLARFEAVVPPAVPAPLLMAGCPMPDGTVGRHFDGKIDSPCILKGVHDEAVFQKLLANRAEPALASELIAAWDFSQEMMSSHTVDLGPLKLNGTLHNIPARAMKGWNWTGDIYEWLRAPSQYGAIHFHSDDLYDASWETSVSLTVPADLCSGPYALHVKCGDTDRDATREAYIAFFVRPPKNQSPTKKVVFLAPTCSYIAYANHQEHITERGVEVVLNRALHFGHSDLYMHDHPENSASLYDRHVDGSGFCYSSRLRPNLNFSPQYHSWLGGHGSGVYQYNADTHLFDWLDHQGIDYDVITDEDLHEEGYDLLKGYQVVLTGTHPEYHSTPMWDAMKTWIDKGGRLMYMGANGWYWRVAFHREMPGVIELRRAEDGIRTWESEPGEYYHAFTGEYGGLWRRIGRAPNALAGVGFIAQGFDESSYYRRAPDADNPRAAFIFDGVPDEIIGNFGMVGGGAAGIELDCITTELGSPPNMLRLASSDGHSGHMLLVNEEFGVVPPNLGGDQNPRVRADLAFGETPSGGALFATSSIAWCGALSHNKYDNNVSRITLNVLKRFLDDTPFETTGD